MFYPSVLITGWSQTCSLWISFEAEASLLEHLRLSGQQQITGLILHPIKLSTFVIVCHV